MPVSTTPAGHVSAKAAAWAVLIGMGGTTMVYNIWHAVHAGHLQIVLALLYGLAPVFAAMGLSHIVATHKGGWFMQSVTFGVMLGAMTLSIGATASVVAPAAGPLRWLFGGVLDAAALIALRVVLDRPAEAISGAIAEATALALEAMPAASDETGQDVIEKALRESQGGPAGGTAVYQFYDRDDDLLYVGVASDFGQRWKDHAASKGWYPEVHRVGITWFSDRETAMAVETEIIRLTAPRYNVQHNPNPEAPRRHGPARSRTKDRIAEKARAEYRRSVRDGRPLSDRALGARFDRSRTWGASRIAEARELPSLTVAK